MNYELIISIFAILISFGALFFSIFVYRKDGNKKKDVLYYGILKEVRDSLVDLKIIMNDERYMSRILMQNKKPTSNELMEEMKKHYKSNQSLKSKIEKIDKKLKNNKDDFKFKQLKQIEYEFNGLYKIFEYLKNTHFEMMDECDELLSMVL